MHFYFILEKNRRKNKMLKLELKRIFSKKINVFAIGLALILAVIFSGFAVTSNRYVDENGNARACLKIKNCTKHMFLCPFS